MSRYSGDCGKRRKGRILREQNMTNYYISYSRDNDDENQ